MNRPDDGPKVVGFVVGLDVGVCEERRSTSREGEFVTPVMLSIKPPVIPASWALANIRVSLADRYASLGETDPSVHLFRGLRP
jgi:hypothetical protein